MCRFQRRAAVGWGSVRVGGTKARLRSPEPVTTAPRAGEKADGLLKARWPAVCPEPCKGGEDAEIARWVTLLQSVCAAFREGLEQKRAWPVHPYAERHFTLLLPEAGSDFCCIQVPVEAAWTLKPTVLVHFSTYPRWFEAILIQWSRLDGIEILFKLDSLGFAHLIGYGGISLITLSAFHKRLRQFFWRQSDQLWFGVGWGRSGTRVWHAVKLHAQPFCALWIHAFGAT